jgi:hypothetical protein
MHIINQYLQQIFRRLLEYRTGVHQPFLGIGPTGVAEFERIVQLKQQHVRDLMVFLTNQTEERYMMQMMRTNIKKTMLPSLPEPSEK